METDEDNLETNQEDTKMAVQIEAQKNTAETTVDKKTTGMTTNQDNLITKEDLEINQETTTDQEILIKDNLQHITLKFRLSIKKNGNFQLF